MLGSSSREQVRGRAVLAQGGLPGQGHLRLHVGSIPDDHGVLEMFMQVVDIFTHPRRKELGGTIMC